VFAPGAVRWIAPAAGAGGAIVLAGAGRLLPFGTAEVAGAVVLFGLAGFFAVFFRDPERATGQGVVSPADGRVRAVDSEGGRLRISVFMNVTNVHVNRAPIDGRIESLRAEGAGFRAAFGPNAGHNVRRRYALSTPIGSVELVQIAGALARRIVPFVRVGSTVRKGDRIGMIVFGSRVDLLLPSDRVRPTVSVGETVTAGVTTVAEERS
jgi:phosphatidylserine decarboxylase